MTDFSQFVLGEWTISESTLEAEGEFDQCNLETTYRFGNDGILNINPIATAYDENNMPYCVGPINDGLGFDISYTIVADRMESELGNATLEKISENSIRLTFDQEELGIVELVR